MAKKKIRECAGKNLLKNHVKRFSPDVSFAKVQPIEVTADTNWSKLKQSESWVANAKLVVKPDMMFGKRGKNDLVLLDASLEEVEAFVNERLGKKIKIGEVAGELSHFLIEPFIPHKEEYYFSIHMEREYTSVFFSTQGGIDVESNWDNVKTLEIPIGESIGDKPKEELEKFYQGVKAELRSATESYINAMFSIFEDLDFVSIETNPFVFVEEDGSFQPIPLDLCAELDDTARFKNMKKWGDLEFPDVFGHSLTLEERFIEDLDAKTGASLKLTVLNPQGLIWNLVAGGGASVIFADTVCDVNCGDLLGNYGEYSGAPTAEQTYHYAKTMLDLATRPLPDGTMAPAKVLLIGGGIANFTDVAKTFQGIVHAMKEYKDKIKAANMRIYVRRAGPNYQKGLKLMKTVGRDLGIPIEVFGPEKNMTEIIPMAIDYIKQSLVKSEEKDERS